MTNEAASVRGGVTDAQGGGGWVGNVLMEDDEDTYSVERPSWRLFGPNAGAS